MHRAIRSQVDDLGDEYDLLTAIIFDPSKDRTRQEFAAEADINVMFAKFGVFGDARKPIAYGEVDYSIDLQQAFAAIEDAKRLWKRMPEGIQEKYPNWQSLLNAANAGELEEAFKPPPPPPTPPVQPVG